MEPFISSSKPILCKVTAGRYQGYYALVRYSTLYQKYKKGSNKEIQFPSLTNESKERFITTELNKRGYKLVKLPHNLSSKEPLTVETPEGKINTVYSWADFYLKLQNWDKCNRRAGVCKESFLPYKQAWEQKYDVTIISEYAGVHQPIVYKHNSGKFKGLVGETTGYWVKNCAEPTLRSLRYDSVLAYYDRLCAQLQLRRLSVEPSGNRSRAKFICEKIGGMYKGYHMLATVDSLQSAIVKKDNFDNFRSLLPNEKVRFVYDTVEYRGYQLITPVTTKINVHDTVGVRCSNGHEYTVKWYAFQQGSGCPVCSESKGEQLIRDLLRSNNVLFDSQKTIETNWAKKQFFDFYLPDYKIAIEYNGKQHYEPIEFFGGEKAFKLNQARDQAKRDYCAENSITLLELPYTLTDQEVKEKIMQVLINKKIQKK